MKPEAGGQPLEAAYTNFMFIVGTYNSPRKRMIAVDTEDCVLADAAVQKKMITQAFTILSFSCAERCCSGHLWSFRCGDFAWKHFVEFVLYRALATGGSRGGSRLVAIISHLPERQRRLKYLHYVVVAVLCLALLVLSFFNLYTGVATFVLLSAGGFGIGLFYMTIGILMLLVMVDVRLANFMNSSAWIQKIFLTRRSVRNNSTSRHQPTSRTTYPLWR